MADFKEFEFINALPNGDAKGLLMGIGDDAALIDDQCSWAISSDAMAEGVHFSKDDDPEAIGRKLVSVNLSDMAAMACEPRFFSLQLHLGVAWQDDEKVRALMRGFTAQLELFNVVLIGGDTICTREQGLQLSGTILGSPWGLSPITRSGAREGDVIVVTGALGGSYPTRHLQFTPRVEWSKKLTESIEVHAMIDLSDGLCQDLGHILDRSEVAAEIELSKVPIHPDIQNDPRSLEKALGDGEDFELLFTCREGDLGLIPEDLSWTVIGKIVEGDGEIWTNEGDTKEMMPRVGYTHQSPKE